MHFTGVHNPPSAMIATAAKIDRVRRPTISPAGSSEDWSYFISRWQDYKDATSHWERPCHPTS